MSPALAHDLVAFAQALLRSTDNGDAVIVLVTGNPSLASAIAGEWTLWQTGVVDILSIGRAVRSAIVPWLLGLASMAAVWVWRGRRRSHAG